MTSNQLGYVLADKYDPRDYNLLITNERNQQSSSLCWLYSSIGAAENSFYRKYGTRPELSKAHGAVSLSTQVKPYGYNGNGYYSTEPDVQGYFGKAFQYITNWNTPVFNEDTVQWNSLVPESDYPLSNVLDSQYDLSDSFLNSESIVNVSGIKYIKSCFFKDQNNNYTQTDGSRESLKRAVIEYGAVGAGITLYPELIKQFGQDKCYFHSVLEEQPTHAVMIVGWDDNFSKNNFKGVPTDPNAPVPSENGAWLVKNSTNENRLFWMSYYEGSLGKEDKNYFVVTDVQRATNKERMLSYDYLPLNKTIDSFNEDVYFCNVFDVEDYTTEYDSINKVMFYIASEREVDYSVKIISLDSNGNLPTNLTLYSVLASGSFQGEGFVTANLNTLFVFQSNNKCAVIIRLIPRYNDSNIYIPYETNYTNGNNILAYPEVNYNESFYYITENNNQLSWSDCKQSNTYGIYGNLSVRPILYNSDAESNTVEISPTNIVDNNHHQYVFLSQTKRLLSIHTLDNHIVREGVDFDKVSTGVRIRKQFISSLNGTYTPLVLEFSNDETAMLYINPKSEITDVVISGKPIVGNTLSASVMGDPVRDNYEVTYQWQYSVNGNAWTNISGANSANYVVDENLLGRYLRVEVAPQSQFCNVSTGNVSDRTSCKVVILGDVNLDGEVSILDVTLIQCYFAEMIPAFTEEQFLAADLNNDSQITLEDCTLLQQFLANY